MKITTSWSMAGKLKTYRSPAGEGGGYKIFQLFQTLTAFCSQLNKLMLVYLDTISLYAWLLDLRNTYSEIHSQKYILASGSVQYWH